MVAYCSIFCLASSMVITLSCGAKIQKVHQKCDFAELTESQRRFCEENPEIFASMVRGAMHGLEMCQRRMAVELWNCRNYEESSHSAVYVLDDGGSREAAFLASIRAASMLIQVIQDSFDGVITCADKNVKRTVETRDGEMYFIVHCHTIVEMAKNFIRNFMTNDSLPPVDDPSRAIVENSVDVAFQVVGDLIHVSHIGYTNVYEHLCPQLHTVIDILYSRYRNATKVCVADIEEDPRYAVQRRLILLPNVQNHRQADDGAEELGGRCPSTLANHRLLPLAGQMAYLVETEDYFSYCRSQAPKGRLCYVHHDGEQMSSRRLEDSCNRLCCSMNQAHRARVVRRRGCGQCVGDSCCGEECASCIDLYVTEYRCDP